MKGNGLLKHLLESQDGLDNRKANNEAPVSENKIHW
jgi:hypothetical protein